MIQGDDLLSNIKGLEFTLAAWIYINKMPLVKYGFITGKVSHSDAWPIVLLRKDLKLDIAFGHNNDFEYLTSVNLISLYKWIHISIIVESKKIKLFINGVLDTNVSTVGNARAVMYPLVVGSCPHGLRTHVEHVRTGFNGSLAQYKYYTRALSPIHLRVVLDQGMVGLLIIYMLLFLYYCLCIIYACYSYHVYNTYL